MVKVATVAVLFVAESATGFFKFAARVQDVARFEEHFAYVDIPSLQNSRLPLALSMRTFVASRIGSWIARWRSAPKDSEALSWLGGEIV